MPRAYSKTSKQQIVETWKASMAKWLMSQIPMLATVMTSRALARPIILRPSHKVVMIKGYIRPERLSNKVFETAEYFRDYSGRQSFDDFVSDLPETMRQEVTRYWRLDTFSTRCRRPISKTSAEPGRARGRCSPEIGSKEGIRLAISRNRKA